MAADTFLASFGLIGLRLLEQHGIDRQRFAALLGIAAPGLIDAHQRLPVKLIDRGFELAGALIADPAFALRAASCWHPSYLGTLGYAWLASRSLRTGLCRLVRYARTLGTRSSCRCIDERGGLRFVLEHHRGANRSAYAIADFWLSLVLGMCRSNFGAPLNPHSVRLRRPQPADTTPYHDFFACTVRFGAADDSFLLAQHAVDTRLPCADAQLTAAFDTMLAEQLAALADADLATRCKAYLLERLSCGEPAQDELAGALGMSRRTLQRRLDAQGLNYKRIVDETRNELAHGYLAQADKSVTEIALLLGFSEQSAFCRAFRRWSGLSPSAYRAQLRRA